MIARFWTVYAFSITVVEIVKIQRIAMLSLRRGTDRCSWTGHCRRTQLRPPFWFGLEAITNRPVQIHRRLSYPMHEDHESRRLGGSPDMAVKYIGAVTAAFAIAYLFDMAIAEKKIFGGSTPKTVADKEWWEATDKKFQAWPRTAGPPVVMNPISRQNFIVKSNES
uniref:Uncharacterized protein LOC105054303 n=1 Tax=Elaeis guineensis var. tenera TaxID=51953 RepID=A0A8N4IG99_ELAGV|nr:uncharacterized protein LOC105054303 [Elaeis guineensis]